MELVRAAGRRCVLFALALIVLADPWAPGDAHYVAWRTVRRGAFWTVLPGAVGIIIWGALAGKFVAMGRYFFM